MILNVYHWLQTWCLNEPDYVEYVDNLQFDFLNLVKFEPFFNKNELDKMKIKNKFEARIIRQANISDHNFQIIFNLNYIKNNQSNELITFENPFTFLLVINNKSQIEINIGDGKKWILNLKTTQFLQNGNNKILLQKKKKIFLLK